MLQHKLIQQRQNSWQQAMAEAIRDPAELLRQLDLPAKLLPGSDAMTEQFPMRVPHSFVARMQKGDPDDPLLRQVLPLDAELQDTPGFSLDPVGDHLAIINRGLLQKYQGRVLIMTTAACAIHCRYCFRRHFPYSEQSSRPSQWQEICAEITKDSSINEVILSGGDPLSLADTQLSQLVGMLDRLPQLKRLRIHTRYPIVLPQRINDTLLKWLTKTRLNTVVVIHGNHANEFNDEVATAITKLKSTGATLLNQTVLLRGVNDTIEALSQLSERLFENGVLPYYLHQLDKVQGAAHFEVEREKAQHLITEIRKLLPGYLVPQLVEEIAQAPYKKPL